MRSDDILRTDAMNLLLKELGEVETERFIYLIKREHFDYTEWQHILWDELTIDEIYKLAADREEAENNTDYHYKIPEKSNQTIEHKENKKLTNSKIEIMFDE